MSKNKDLEKQKSAKNTSVNPYTWVLFKNDIDKDEKKHVQRESAFKKLLFFVAVYFVGTVAGYILDASLSGTSAFKTLIITALIALTSSLICFVFKPTTVLFGTVSSLTYGIAIVMLVLSVGKIVGVVSLLFLTVFAVILSMSLFYGLSNVNRDAIKRTTLAVIILSLIVDAALIFVTMPLPKLGEGAKLLLNYPIVTLVAAFAGIVFVTLLLRGDYNSVGALEENKVSDRYEFYTAFAVAFSVIWVYFKIIALIVNFFVKLVRKVKTADDEEPEDEEYESDDTDEDE